MKCEIIRDLLPLYIDQVCSPETEAEVEAHLKTCDKCRSIYADMIREMEHTTPNAAIPNEKAIYIGIRQKIGNLLLCALLFIGFIGLVFGMMNEIGQHGWPQGVFALAFIIPCTAFLLSMMNIFFAKEYPSRSWFSWVSGGIAAGLCLAGDLVALYHYQFPPNWQEMIPYCILIALLFGGISFFITRLYARFCNR